MGDVYAVGHRDGERRDAGSRYQGDYTDGTTGLVHMGARWYDPSTGTFTTNDTLNGAPLPITADGNPYSYTTGNPLTQTDPSGHLDPGSLGTALSAGAASAGADDAESPFCGPLIVVCAVGGGVVAFGVGFGLGYFLPGPSSPSPSTISGLAAPVESAGESWPRSSPWGSGHSARSATPEDPR